MADPTPSSRASALVAYALSATTTLLWVGCVLPSGPLAQPAPHDDVATPFYREGLLLVPAVLLLVLLPVGCALTRRIRGGQALLAATDAFIATYAAIAIWVTSPKDLATGIFALLLLLLGVMSATESIRTSRAQHPRRAHAWMKGSRLAICIMVLMVPAGWVMESNVERASYLAPFFVVAVSAAGALLARTTITLRMTSAVIQLALAIHVVITLRYTLFTGTPQISRLSVFGEVTWGLSLLTLAFAVLQVGILAHERRKALRAAGPEALGGAQPTA